MRQPGLPLTFNELVRDMAARINVRPYASGLREARILVEHVCGHSTAAQIVVGDHPVPHSDCEELLCFVSRREAGEPLARILGKAAFWDFEIALNDDTLIPRDDTSTLVEQALSVIPANAPFRIVDVGTGPGTIALAIARERPKAHITATDISEQALNQARENAAALGVDDRIIFLHGSWLTPADGLFDVIISNPPYISHSEYQSLDLEVRDHDPRIALVAGEDGLDAYRALLEEAKDKLTPQGSVLLEIGASQTDSVRAIGEHAGFVFERALNDMRGQPRVVQFSAQA